MKVFNTRNRGKAVYCQQTYSPCMQERKYYLLSYFVGILLDSRISLTVRTSNSTWYLISAYMQYPCSVPQAGCNRCCSRAADGDRGPREG